MNGVLVYDGDCGFCTTSARWLGGHAKGNVQIVPWQSANLASMNLTEAQCSAAVQCILMSIPPARWLGPTAYKFVAKNRYRLPGATDACRIDQH
jgi:predicted DCC family thiol-disulfide oxidoreductase YuxK